MADCRSNHCREKQRKENFQRKESQKHKLVDKAIPNIANAIRTVVDVSENEDFKANCFNLLKVGNENEFKDVMTERLWNIATSRLDVKQHDGRGQIVPHVKVVEDETEEETNPSEELSGSCFDDLSGKISIYEDFKSKENCFTGGERGKTGPSTWDKDNNSSFEMLADMQWN
ncbi:uncharacterized protein [Pocillopora verrucosa]|uniref:uncharacterized protein isoform X3 n=1 Tax=Pocillopora verrucosa TaxID=203993 RepID=UPI0033426D2F